VGGDGERKSGPAPTEHVGAATTPPAASERFVIQQRLGAGGMGVVYQAYDHQRKSIVALKTLQELTPGALYRFKKEFRALADLSHPNLVSLYELLSVGDEWFFTMELLQAVDFLRFVRPAHGTFDVTRLRAALGQLAQGVAALHRAGQLHRDLKPSNVLVTDRGRVVICDFGLVTEVETTREYPTREDRVLGTVAYMSPEQAACLPLTAASDWYSVGVMLYHALTGQPPFAGDEHDIMVEKQLREPPAPKTRASGVPDDLSQLAVDLLRRHPAQRLAGRDALVRCGVSEPEAPAQPSLTAGALLLGRERVLAALADAFKGPQKERGVMVLLHGGSGVGKTAIMRRFLEDLTDTEGAVVLRGRCYERESVPYKGLDSLVDALTAYLVRLPAPEVESLLPPGITSLARLFPVLCRVKSVPAPPPRALEAPDPQQLRARAFAALRQLLSRIARRRPLVLAIDDAQWGDLDSAALLAALVRPPDPPPLLLLVCYRSDEQETSPFLKAFRQLTDPASSACEVRDVPVEPLSREGARELAVALLDKAESPALAETIADESGGNPFFVQELVRHMRSRAHMEVAAGEKISLDEVLRVRFERLPEDAQLLLRLIAVGGGPVSQEAVLRAAGLDANQSTALSVLRAERLVRSRGIRSHDDVETFHDRIREAVIRFLPIEQRTQIHLRLAEALQAGEHADPRMLAEHYLAADQPEKASHYAEQAAGHAAEALAFDRAAELYRLAIELRPASDPTEKHLRSLLGDALANAGRGADAASAYLAAASAASPAEALELRRRAAEQLLRSGHFSEGVTTVREVLSAVNIALPENPRTALVSLVFQRAIRRLRGLGFNERDPSQIPPSELTRIDICWTAAIGLALIDMIRAEDFQTKHLLMALRAGEPYRIARAICMETVFVAGTGRFDEAGVDRLTELARKVAERSGKPQAIALATAVTGIVDFVQGRWKTGQDLCEEAERIFRERCTGTAWELATAQFFILSALYYTGEIGELSRRAPALVREAQEHNDLYGATTLRTWPVNIIWLAADDPDRARAEVEDAMRRWSREGFHLQHAYELLALSQADLYAGEAKLVWDRLEQGWSRMRRSLLLRLRNLRMSAWHMRARSALALAARGEATPKGLAMARRAARVMEAGHLPWCVALSRVVRAGLAGISGDPEAAAEALERAAAACEGAGLGLFAAAARHRRGMLLGGDQGRAEVVAAEQWMAQRAIRNPKRMVAMLVPGFKD
jgi:tetratricopeptide (TPR) repeat protein